MKPKRRARGEGAIYERKDRTWGAAFTAGYDAQGRFSERQKGRDEKTIETEEEAPARKR